MMTILGQSGTMDKKVNSFYEKGCAYLRIYRPGIEAGKGVEVIVGVPVKETAKYSILQVRKHK